MGTAPRPGRQAPPTLPPYDPSRETRDHLSLEAWGDVLRDLQARHGLPGELVPFSDGTAVVWGTDTHVLKLTAPCYAADLVNEADYPRIAAALSLTLPQVVASGEVSGWPYVVMTRVHGRALSDLWPGLDPSARVALARHLGDLVRGLQGLAPPAESVRAWPEFLRSTEAAAAGRQRGVFGPDVTTALFAAHPVDPEAPVGVCHTELLGDHVRLEEGPDGWRVVSLLDWAEARAAPAGLEVASLVEFVFQGAPGCLGAFVDAAGLDPDPEALLAWTLRHPYSTLPRIVRRFAEPPGSLEALCAAWFTL